MKDRCRLSHIFMVLLIAVSAGSVFSQGSSVGSTTLYSVRHPEIAKRRPIKRELFRFLKMSPVLANVLSYDPTLLRQHEYINSQNPGLAAFLKLHPEIAADAEFYLFGVLMEQGVGRNSDYLTRRDPGIEVRQNGRGNDQMFFVFVFFIIAGAIVWLFYMFLQNRRWSRVFRAQTELNAKLLDKFGGSQELLSYLDTEAGRRLGQGIPMDAAAHYWGRQAPAGSMSRILAPMQFGVVLAVAGVGILVTRLFLNDSGSLLFMGAMALALGIGLIMAAGLSWYLARRFALGAPTEPPQSSSNCQ